jgi:dimethylglycine dehydrogenase
MADGDPGFDVWAMDVARFGDWATRSYTNVKVRENYGRRFRVRFPNEELPAARPLRTTPMYHKWLELGAVMGDNWSLEAPLWFAPKGVKDEFSFHRSTDFPHVRAEVKAVRDGVGISETSTFAKYEITGANAEAWLSHMLANKIPKEGRLTLTPMLNHAGKLIGDFTIAKAGPERFYIFGSGAAEKYHMRWFEQHLPKDGTVKVVALGQALTGLSIAGPKSRDVLAKVTDEDVSSKAFRFMDFRPQMEIGMVPAMVGRITFTGDLGFEMWVKPEHQVALFTALWEAGQEHGIRPFGSRALLSLAREKNFGTWAREFRPIYGPFEADLGRFVDLTKNDFIGRTEAAKEKRDGPKRTRVSFVVDASDADAIGDEAVWKDGNVVGWITSGGYCHHADRSLAIGYVPTESLANGADKATWEIEILGEMRPARLQLEPLFDPKAERMRG